MSDQTGSGSLTALPVIECGRTGPGRMEPMGRGEIDGSNYIQATMKSNPKTQFVSRTVRKDTYGVQESQIILFRREVPKFNKGTSGSLRAFISLQTAGFHSPDSCFGWSQHFDATSLGVHGFGAWSKWLRVAVAFKCLIVSRLVVPVQAVPWQ